ncbi:transposase [Pseudoduganella ginsengisoli]|nr:transposase [Pseudoduganella ginsengisoli]
MARKLRIHVAGGLYHVILRGNNRQPIFHDDKDRYRLEDLIEEGSSRFHYQLLGYCWMGNHIHAAVQVGKVPLSSAIQNLSFRYAGYFNWRYQRVGHLFQGRFKAILIDSDSYLLQLVRYIHMNPVRAQLVDTPDAWAWSSHRAYVGEIAAPPWLDTAPVLARFSDRPQRARKAYRTFMGMPEKMMSPLDFERGNQKVPILGDELFAHRMERKAFRDAPAMEQFSAEEIVNAVCLAAGMSGEGICTSRRADALHARMAAAHLVLTRSDRNLTALARMMARDPSTLSRAAMRYEASEAAQEVAGRALAVLANARMHA